MTPLGVSGVLLTRPRAETVHGREKCDSGSVINKEVTPLLSKCTKSAEREKASPAAASKISKRRVNRKKVRNTANSFRNENSFDQRPLVKFTQERRF